MNSQVLICNGINLDRNYKNVVNYTESDMVTLCANHAIRHATNFNFIKQGRNEIEVPFTYEECLKANYMAFQNPSYSNKWFFAFVDEVEFRNPSTTRIRYTIDAFSTWFDYWDAKSCFVMREHVTDDTIGRHTIDEGLNFGDYIINSTGEILSSLNTTYICIATAWLPDNTPFYSNNRVFGGVYSGVSYILFAQTESASKFIQALDDMGKDSYSIILGIFMIPQALSGAPADISTWPTGSLGNQTGIRFYPLPNVATTRTLLSNYTISSPSALDGYTPKNNKLLVAPYNMLSITNNAGTQLDFKYEDFINRTPTFDIVGVPNMTTSISLVPVNYKLNNTSKAGYNWMLPLAKFPQGSWVSDTYTNWMVANGVNILGHQIDAPTSHAIMGSLQAITGATTMGLNAEVSGGGILGGFSSMLGAVQESYRASLMPPAIGGQTSSLDVAYGYAKMSPTYYKMTIKAEYARIIDDWLSRFGYKINRVKIPNQVGRTYWNYVQIGASEIIGYPNTKNFGIPKSDMETINNIYRAGVTIWHNHDNIGNYSLSNTIASS